MRERHRDRLADAAALALDERAEDALEAWCAAAIEQNGALTNAGPGARREDEKEVQPPIAAITIDSQPFTDARRESSPNALMRAWTSAGFDGAEVVGVEPEPGGDAGAPSRRRTRRCGRSAPGRAPGRRRG